MLFDLDRAQLAGRAVLLAGAGNIGSHLAPLLARAGLGRLILLDRDTVEAKNLRTQDFQPGDVGQPKAAVLADRLRKQFPAQRIEARVCDLEDLPLGEAEVDVLLGGLDSRRGRQVLISEVGWPLGVPVVDGGVGEGLVGRVQVFLPGPTTACLECTWGYADYRHLAAEYPCQPGADAQSPSTISTGFLGALVASVMATECLRLLAGEPPAESYEVPFDLWNHALRRYQLRRTHQCRYDHEVVGERVNLQGHGAVPTVGELLNQIEHRFDSQRTHLEVRRGTRVAPEGARFVSPQSLRALQHEPVTALGLVTGDRIRVRGPQGSVFVAV